MAIVELDKIRGALVGIPGSSGLSVEARKRLSIGVEMVANPSVIFMDEPTSGAWAPASRNPALKSVLYRYFQGTPDQVCQDSLNGKGINSWQGSRAFGWI